MPGWDAEQINEIFVGSYCGLHTLLTSAFTAGNKAEGPVTGGPHSNGGEAINGTNGENRCLVRRW